MGQLEKIVVLTVLSLVALILVVTFQKGDSTELLAGPEAGQEQAEDGLPRPASIVGRQAREGSASAPSPRSLDLARPFDQVASTDPELGLHEWPAGDAGSGDSAEGQGRNGLLLSSTVSGAEGEPTYARDPALPEDAALITLRGLEDTWDPELKQYVWTASDTFASLARRFYGERGSVELLLIANEGRDTIAAGETILVPVFDRRGETPARPSAGRTHVVQEGESLWSIAKELYGRGQDWQKLFDANRDRLPSPDAMRSGLELIVP